MDKQRLERTIAAGNKLANLEEREMARMDAFRVAVSFAYSFFFLHCLQFVKISEYSVGRPNGSYQCRRIGDY